ncbi:MAG: EAL domain-containing protein [Desulfobulbus sp.]|jgi:diguanylate cyclase (GGDEF)-like protein/PAS domain S-box-containing protein|uniref:bifunctional diguanylate cyclase/phosphodiesterase n=1 Tax=Desulfobulbus sp. TaxID=895 RepID=UPI00284C8DA1|nr:EAL domain-containing protein [Desulfobulbus sp.]MDR2551096.1 EAL domain-containing protein [Desulfobulbus sp.]
MGISSRIGKRLKIEQWSIGKKTFFGTILFLLLPLLALCAVLFRISLERFNTSIEEGMEAAGLSAAAMVEASVDASLRGYLHGIVENNMRQIELVQAKWAGSGATGANLAKQEIFAAMKVQKIGPSGYVYCIDSTGVILFHPREALIGKNILQAEELREYWPFIKRQLETKRGYLEYSWKNPDEAGPHPKALSMEYFHPWDWIVSAVCYREEVERFIDFRDVERRMVGIKYGASGYAFLLNSQAKLLAHPLVFEKTAADVYAARLKPILEAGSKDMDRTMRLLWDGGADRPAKERLFFFHRIPQFDLTVGLTTDAAEAEAGLLAIKTTGILAVLLGTAFAVGASFRLSRAIVAPLRRFAHQLNIPIAKGSGGGCEATALLVAFEEHLLGVRSANKKLVAEAHRRKSAETFLHLYKKIFDNSPEGMAITDASGRILAVNEAFTTITGYGQDEAIGANPRLLKSGRHDGVFYAEMWQQLLARGLWEGEIWNKKKDGTVYPEWLTISAIRNDRRETAYYFASFYEIGEQKKREWQIAYMAYHDLLTRLPNRIGLERKLGAACARASNEGTKVSLLYIDLDNFKNINDVLGYKQGDDLLIQVSQRLSSLLTDNNTLYRIGGDEFLLLMERIDNESLIPLAADQIQAVLNEPFLLDFKKIYVNASIGITVFPDDCDNPPDLIRSADMAMHKAKREGKNRHAMFSREMHDELLKRLQTENKIRTGLLNREFIVYYQPKVDIETRTASSLEALIRWEQGNRIVSPGAFIPIAEESSLIDDLCLLVLEQACIFHGTMREQGVAVPISVNVAPRQFHNSDFVDIVGELFSQYRIEADAIEFEITETTAMTDVDHTLKVMNRLRELGVSFSIDDFGTGYSSLGLLSKMPVSTLKIDKQFVDDMDTHGGIVATIVAICQQMRLKVVAEGVETEEQLHRLEALGCHEAQGYYFSRPIPGDDVLKYLAAERVGQGGPPPH